MGTAAARPHTALELPAVTALIDNIAQAFVLARDEAKMNGGVITCRRVVEAIEMAVKCDDHEGWLEGIVDVAFEQARIGYGGDWPYQTDAVAELVMDGLSDWIALTL